MRNIVRIVINIAEGSALELNRDRKERRDRGRGGGEQGNGACFFPFVS